MRCSKVLCWSAVDEGVCVCVCVCVCFFSRTFFPQKVLELGRPDGRPYDGDALLFWQELSRPNPHLWSEVSHVGRTVAAVVPYPGFAGFGRVELDVRMLLQFVGKDVVCCLNSVGGDDEVDVV